MYRRLRVGSTSRLKPDVVYVCRDSDSVWIEINLSSKDLSPNVGRQLASLIKDASGQADLWNSTREDHDKSECATIDSLKEDLRDIVREEIDDALSKRLIKLNQ